MKRAVLLTAIITLLTAACGSDGDSASRDQDLIDAMTADFLAEESALTTDEDEARCTAEGTYDAIGPDRLAELGITVESPDPGEVDLTQSEVEGMVDAIFDCVDMSQSFADSLVGGGIDQASADCIAAEFGEDEIRDFMASSFNVEEPTTDFIAKMTSSAVACGVDMFG